MGMALRAQRTEIPILIFFFNDTATTEIYTLSLHDALPISRIEGDTSRKWGIEEKNGYTATTWQRYQVWFRRRSEEHTSELQSQSNLVCRLLLEKNKESRHSDTRLLSRTGHAPSVLTTCSRQ